METWRLGDFWNRLDIFEKDYQLDLETINWTWRLGDFWNRLDMWNQLDLEIFITKYLESTRFGDIYYQIFGIY